MKLNEKNANYVLFYGVGSNLCFKRYFRSEKSLYRAWRCLYMLNTKIFFIDSYGDKFLMTFDNSKELHFI